MTSPAWSREPRRERASATASSARSARPTRSATSSAATPTTAFPHPDGSVDPLRDIETIETELLLADYEQAERRLERVAKQARSGDPAAIAERDWLEPVRDGAGRRAAGALGPGARGGAASAPVDLHALTSKPVLYVANVDEGEPSVPHGRSPPTPRRPGRRRSRSAPGSRPSWPSSTRRGGGDAARPTGSRAPGLERLVSAAYDLLDLITFFTAGEDKRGVRPAACGAAAPPGMRPGGPHRDPGRLRQGRGDRLARAGRAAAATPPPATAASCGSRAATTSSPTAT